MKGPTEIRSQRAALEQKLAELTAGFQDRSGLAIENSADILDTIRMATDRDVLVQSMNINAQVLSDVREALTRLDNGEYGVCEDCDEATCQVRHMMLEVRQAIAEVLDNRSLAAMRDADNDDFPVELTSQI